MALQNTTRVERCLNRESESVGYNANTFYRAFRENLCRGLQEPADLCWQFVHSLEEKGWTESLSLIKYYVTLYVPRFDVIPPDDILDILETVPMYVSPW